MQRLSFLRKQESRIGTVDSASSAERQLLKSYATAGRMGRAWPQGIFLPMRFISNRPYSP